MSGDNISPLESVLANCPSCQRTFLEQRLSPQAYRVTSSDTDFYPAERVWLYPEVPDVCPLFYFMQTCPSCLYTMEVNETIFQLAPQPVEGRQERLQIQRHMSELSKPGSVLDKLAYGFKACQDPFGRVVIKFLLGIYDEKLKDEYSNYSLARFYLRLAWVFRENNSPTRRASYSEWTLVKQNVERLAEQHRTYFHQIEKLRGLLEQKFLTVGQEHQKPGPEAEHYRELLKKIEEQVMPVKDEMAGLLSKMKEKGSPTDSKKEDNPFSLSGFLLDLKTAWLGTAMSESEALKFALSYYRQYFQSLPQETSPGNQIQTAYLIGELSRRVGEYLESQKYLSLTISLGEECVKKEKHSYRSAFAKKIIDMASQQHVLAERQRQNQAL